MDKHDYALINSLTESVLEGDYVQTEALLHKGADPNSLNEYGTTPFLVAVDQGDYCMASFLLEAGANSDQPFELEKYPISLAVNRGHSEMIKVLAKYGADIFRRVDGTHSYLDNAYRNQQHRSAVTLRELGLSIENSYIAAVDKKAKQWLI